MFSKLICYCTIRFSYKIRKKIRNISINIPSHEVKRVFFSFLIGKIKSIYRKGRPKGVPGMQ